MQRAIEVVELVADRFHFTFNPTKSETCTYGADSDEKYTFVLGGKALKEVTVFEYLGVKLQQDGRWTVEGLAARFGEVGQEPMPILERLKEMESAAKSGEKPNQ